MRPTEYILGLSTFKHLYEQRLVFPGRPTVARIL